jgi:hypothetical protein
MLQQVNPRDPDASLVPVFRNHAQPNEEKSRAEGRPIYDDIEVVDIRRPGSRDWHTHPATEVCGWTVDPETGGQVQITYAERFSRQYQQFKAKQQQTKSGTPLDHAPFLTEGRRAELRAQNVYTVEQLAAIDGQELKNLGQGGREMKNWAMEYIADAKVSAPSMQLQAELEALRARNQVLEEDNEALKQRTAAVEAQFEDMTEDQIRKYIQTYTGHPPQGNLPRKTLVRMAMDARPNKAA